MLEITVLVSSPAQAEDVVNCGADAVLLRFDSSAQRSGGAYFTRFELAQTVRFCHVSGAKVYLWLDKELTDENETALCANIEAACECGVDAIRVEDAGLARMVKMLCPKMSLHAGSSLAANSLYGAAALLGLGFERISCVFDTVAFASFLEQKKFTPELTALSPGCSALSGRCYIASLRGKKPTRCGFACRGKVDQHFAERIKLCHRFFLSYKTPSSRHFKTNSLKREFDHANHGRVNCAGSSLWKPSCIKPVSASQVVSI